MRTADTFDGRSPMLGGGLPPSAHAKTISRRDAAAQNVQPRIRSSDGQQQDRTALLVNGMLLQGSTLRKM